MKIILKGKGDRLDGSLDIYGLFDGMSLFIDGRKGEIIGLDPIDARRRWKVKRPSSIVVRTVGSDLAVWEKGPRTLGVHDTVTGVRLWGLTLPEGAQPTFFNGKRRVLVRGKKGISVYRAADGALEWTHPVGSEFRVHTLKAGRILYSTKGRLHCIYETTGRKAWEIPFAKDLRWLWFKTAGKN
jgi:outer membrane protein assembly factor BamB